MVCLLNEITAIDTKLILLIDIPNFSSSNQKITQETQKALLQIEAKSF